MKSLIIYCSDYKKNTEKIARLFASKINSELLNIREASDVDISDYDLIGFGSGVYQETLSPKLYKLVNKLNVQGKSVFIFSTSGVGMTFYNKKLINLLESKGAINKGSFACKGGFVAKDFTNVKIFDFMSKLSQGHPNEKDFLMAEKFIEKVIDLL